MLLSELLKIYLALILFVAFNDDTISNVACLSWLNEGMNSRRNPNEEKGYGMIPNADKIVEITEGSITTSRMKQELQRNFFWNKDE